MTLVELLIALSIVAMVGLAATAAAVAVSGAHARTSLRADNIQAARISMSRVEALIRQARLVIEGDDDHLYLWMGDTNSNGSINPDEVAVLSYLPQERVVRMSQVCFPAGIDPLLKASLNVDLTLAEAGDPATLELLVGLLSYVVETDVACEVDALAFRFSPGPPLSRTVSIVSRFGSGAEAVSLNSTVCLRASAADCVTAVGGQYVLQLPAAEVTVGF